MATIPTDKPVGSNDVKDLLFNSEKLDEVVNSDSLTYVDRKSNERLTIKGLEEAAVSAGPTVEAAAKALEILNGANDNVASAKTAAAESAVSAAEAKASADKAEAVVDVEGTYPTIEAGLDSTSDGKYFRVPQGEGQGFKYYRNVNNSAIGVADLPGSSAIDSAIDTLDSRITKIPTSTTGTPKEWVAGVLFDGGYLAPFMRDDGRLIYIDEDGVEQVVASEELVALNEKVTSDVADKVNNTVTKLPNSAVNAPEQWVAGVWFEGDYFAPFMRDDGRLIFINSDGKECLAASDDDIYYRPFFNGARFELPDGAICIRCNVDAGMYIHEAWSADGGYYVATDSGLYRVGDQPSPASRRVYSSAVASVMGMTSTRVAVDTDQTICYIIVGWGQSLSQGWNTLNGDALIAASQLYPDNCFMFKSTRGAGKENPNRNLNVEPVTQLESLKETINGGWKETSQSSLASHLVYEVEKHTGHRIRTLSFIAANGGKPYMDLTKGTNVWDALVQGLIDARNICVDRGWKPVVLGLDVMAGETDNHAAYMTRERYARQLMQLDRNFNAEVRRIFPEQNEDAIISVSQSAYTPIQWDQPVRQAQYDCDGIGNIRLAGPVYPFPSGDVIHINSLGQNRRGQMVSRVFFWEKFATGWRPIKCTGYTWLSATKLRLKFDSPKGLVLDTTDSIVQSSGLGAGLGFVCDDGTASPPNITNVAVINDSSVDITLSKPFSDGSGRIAYAIKRNDGNTTQDGPDVGARGCLRDDTKHESLYESGVTHANWCSSFIIYIN